MKDRGRAARRLLARLARADGEDEEAVREEAQRLLLERHLAARRPPPAQPETPAPTP